MKNLSFKTILGASVVAVSAVCRYLGYDEVSNLVITLGGSLAVVGIGHKIDKVKKTLK